MKIEKTEIKALKIVDIPIDLFDQILESLQHKLTPDEEEKGMGSNHGGLVLPFALSQTASGDDGEGYLILYPRLIGYEKTRNMIEKAFEIKLSDYEVIVIFDLR